MGATQTTGLGAAAAGALGRTINPTDIQKSDSLGGNRVKVTLTSGEVVLGRKLPDGRIIRGAEDDRPED